MEKDKKKKSRLVSLILLVVMAAVMIFVFRVAFANISGLFQRQLYTSVTEQKQELLESTVTNLVADIKVDRHEEQEKFLQIADTYKSDAEDAMKSTGNIKTRVKSMFARGPYAKYWSYMLYKKSSNSIYLDSDGLLGDSFNGNIKGLENDFVVMNKVEENGFVLIYGVLQETLDEDIQKVFEEKVKNYQFPDDSSSIWVDEIRNYEGGKNYAVCVCDSANEEQEGRKRSTKITDKKGRTYLEKALLKLNEEGEVTYTYYVTDNSVKMVYAKLYDDYNWVISMGVDLDDVVSYVNVAKNSSVKVIRIYGIVLTGIFILVLVLLYFITVKNDKDYFESRQRHLTTQVERDKLTRAYSRAFGTQKFEEVFREFKKGKESPAYMILDVDYFKSINDTYGHEAGDLILKRVVTTLNHVVRKTDYIIRWGGDEFIGIFPGLGREDCEELAEKIVSSIYNMEVVFADQVLKVTCSVGFAYFEEQDKNFNEGLKRADEALYLSKEGGRNQAHVAKNSVEKN
ncbi:MAG: diguanylate cyclase [Lachnospiraceae bacterium]|nr:diguanylate cyclase [Lachnospiraceae bacterium]